jgi:hypothetical protein
VVVDLDGEHVLYSSLKFVHGCNAIATGLLLVVLEESVDLAIEGATLRKRDESCIARNAQRGDVLRIVIYGHDENRIEPLARPLGISVI